MSQVESLCKAFEYGVNYGMLIMEEERDSEDLFDATECYFHALKTAMPSMQSKRRQPHSKEWRNAMKQSMFDFIKLVSDVEVKNERL